MGRIDEICREINKKFDNNIAQKGVERSKEPLIPFSSVRLNYMTYGGLPRTGLIEFYGENNGGKTTLALDVVGNAQKLFKKEWEDKTRELEGKKDKNRQEGHDLDFLKERGPLRVVFFDAEHSLDEEWARKHGVNTDELYWIRPQNQTAEQVLEMMLDFCRSEEVGLIVLDSVAKLVGQNIMEETLEKKAYGGISIPVTAFCNRYDSLPIRQKPLLIFINQVRENMGDSWAQYVTPGGQALKFTARVRLMIQKGKYLDWGGSEQSNSCENPQGNVVKVAVAKTKVFKPDRRVGQFKLMYSKGIDVWNDLVETAKQLEIIITSGSWISIIDKQTGEVRKDSEGVTLKFQGSLRLWDYLIAHPQWVEEFMNEINSIISQ